MLAKILRAVYNKGKKKTTGRRLVLPRWLVILCDENNRSQLELGGGYFCLRTIIINRIKNNSVSCIVFTPFGRITPFCEGVNKTACR